MKDQIKYRVFVRNWYKVNPAWPNGLEPDGNARKTTIATNIVGEQAARTIALEYNRTHKAGKLSRKAEIESI